MTRQWTRQAALQDSKRHVSRQLVSLVNPRLALYTRAGFLAATILAINFAIVACLALVLQRDCTDSTIVDRSSPVTFGDFLTYEEFINTTLSREGEVREGTTTTNTTVSGCVKRNSAVLVAPYRASLCYDTCRLSNLYKLTRDGICDDGGPGSEYDFDRDKQQTQMTMSSTCPLGSDCTDCGVRDPPPSYSGTGITADVPCWNQYVPCFQYWSNSYSYSYDYAEEQNASLQQQNFQPPCGWYRTSEAEVVGGASYKFEMGRKADRFPWCSEEVHDDARQKHVRLSNLTSMNQSSVNLAIICGSSKMNGIPVTPGGVLHPNLSPAQGENLIGTMTSFTTHWSLNVTTKRTVCPRFSAAFSSALAFAAYIEIIITMVLVYVFKMCALIEDEKGVIDLSGGIVQHAKLKQATVDSGRKPVDLPHVV